MKTVYLTIMGRNDVGIIAAVSQLLLSYQVSIHDITQKIMDPNFVLFMELKCKRDISVQNLQSHLEQATRSFHLKIMLAEEELFNAMHRI